MKKIVYKYIILLIFCFGCIQCTNDDGYLPSIALELLFVKNNPQPINVDTLRILAIGNSYTEDGMHYLHHITDSVGIDKKRLGVYYAVTQGASLEQWLRTYESNDTVHLIMSAGQYKMNSKAPLRELFHQDWDIITFQQYSLYAGEFKTYNPYLHYLRNYAMKECTNPNVCIAWNMVWSYAKGYKHYDPAKYAHIVNATRKMSEIYGIDCIIPSGTAIENARNTSLQDGHDLTRDGTHLSFAIGSYITGCTWYESLIAPAFNAHIYNLRFSYTPYDWEKRYSNFECTSITEENIPLIHRCIKESIIHPYCITQINE